MFVRFPVMNREPLNEITARDIAAFDRDGAICLRRVIDADWIDRLGRAVDRWMADPGPLAQEFTKPGQPGRFFGDKYMWTLDPVFRRYVFESPAAIIAGRLMKAHRINLFFDHLLVKEPGTSDATPWHQDQPYWQVDGWQVCSVWLPLDPVSAASGATEYVQGSHRWNKWYEPRSFGGTRSYQAGGEPMPDIEAQRDRLDILSWDVEPGDVIVHHALTIHGARPNNSGDRRRRALATRWAGDDARFAIRDKAPPIIRDPGLAPGAAMDCDLFPQVWSRAEAA